MRRIVLLATLAAIMAVVTVTLAGTSFAQGQGVGSCFGEEQSTEKAPPGPGEDVSTAATTLAQPGPEFRGSGVPVAAQNIGLAQHARPCPPPPQ